jgi:hypothetical protein
MSPGLFPYSADALNAAFTRACKMPGIDDLHFHDLRHDGIAGLSKWEKPFRGQQVFQVAEAGAKTPFRQRLHQLQ